MLYSPVWGPLPSNAAMHIPDGYLSPATALVLFLLALPFWYRGARKISEAANARSIPLIALLSAFSFIVMMFNVPLPGGTTGHAVGGVLAAILLGPEVASVAISIALIIQAFFFGDGGILAIGANSFNMAIVMPYVGYSVYRLLAGSSDVRSRRRIVAGAVAGWTGLTLAAFFTAVEFGLQPILFHTANGAPLYAPYPLGIALPAMLIPHMLVASVIEGAITALVIAYLQKANRPILEWQVRPQMVHRLRGLWVAVAALAVATPLGLLAPGTAWGEWNSTELAGMGLGFVPAGLKQLEGLWGAPLRRYELPGLGNLDAGYVLSAVLGVALVVILMWLFSLVVTPRRKSERAEG